MFFFEENGQNSFYKADYSKESYLVFGCESKGLPHEILEPMADRIFSLPMRNSRVKSLNLSNAATAAIYQAMRDHW
jgi:tRNA (cytidine/uridine-2'-O-)-methyltransferase